MTRRCDLTGVAFATRILVYTSADHTVVLWDITRRAQGVAVRPHPIGQIPRVQPERPHPRHRRKGSDHHPL